MNTYMKIIRVCCYILGLGFLFNSLILKEDFTESIFWLLYIDSLIWVKTLRGKNE